MKKIMITAAGLAVVAAPTYASKARLTALSQDATVGSYYVPDQRSIFSNPAYLNTYNNYVIVEYGQDIDSTDGTDTTGTASAADPHAQGGFARQAGNFVYSVFLGNDNQDGRSTDAATSGLSTGDFINENNRLELSFAGDAGIKWGATVWHSMQSKEFDNGSNGADEVDGDTMGLRAGVIAGAIEAYAELDFKDEAQGTHDETSAAVDKDDKYEGDFGIKVGAFYGWGNWGFFGEYAKSGHEVTDDSLTANKTGSYENSTIVLGAGHTAKLDDKATLFYDVTLTNVAIEDKDVGSTETLKDDDMSLKLTVAYEAKANSWLTLRGSIGQNIYSTADDTAATSGAPELASKGLGTTTVGAGAALTFGKLVVDGTISTSGTYSLGTNTLGNMSVHYWF